MPVPKPKDGESKDAFISRCMHEVSKNKDRTNEQNVAICLSTWRDAKGEPEPKKKSELTETEISKMNESAFKTLASAREEYTKLSLELSSAKERLANFEALEADNSDLATQLENARKTIALSSEQIASRDAAINSKDEEIKTLSGNLSVLTTRCADLEKSAKSVKAQARELVAASAGAPASVDNSEMEMSQDDIVRAMRSETDSKKLNALYRQFKSQQKTNQ